MMISYHLFSVFQTRFFVYVQHIFAIWLGSYQNDDTLSLLISFILFILDMRVRGVIRME